MLAINIVLNYLISLPKILITSRKVEMFSRIIGDEPFSFNITPTNSAILLAEEPTSFTGTYKQT